MRILFLNMSLCVPYDLIMALRSEVQWKEFFQTAGIEDTTSSTYAKSFADNGVTETSLPQIDKETLTELGVTVIGHRLSVLQGARTHNVDQTPPAVQSTSVAKASVTAKLSTITHEMTHPQFRKFHRIQIHPQKLKGYQVLPSGPCHLPGFFLPGFFEIAVHYPFLPGKVPNVTR